MSGECILIVEDEPLVRDYLRSVLEAADQDYQITELAGGTELLSEARPLQPCVILLDLMLGPGPDGLELCRLIRSDEGLSTCGLIVVTGRLDAGDEHRALFAGADLCLRKEDLTPRVLLTNVQEMIRVVHGRSGPVIVCGDLVLHRVTRRAWDRERPLRFSPLEFRIVWKLCQQPGRVIVYRELLDHGPTSPLERTRRVAHTMISAVRKRLGRLGNHIETVRGKGYRWRPRIDADVGSRAT